MSCWSARATQRECVRRRTMPESLDSPSAIRASEHSVASAIGSRRVAFYGLGVLGLRSVAWKTALNGGLSAEWGVQLRA